MIIYSGSRIRAATATGALVCAVVTCIFAIAESNLSARDVLLVAGNTFQCTLDEPDLSSQTVKIGDWMREEILASEQVRLFNMLAKEKGRAFAFDWFKDGEGYFMEARTWVPFVPVSRAFILYLCWEQANLRGSRVSLEKLDDHEAVITLEPHYLKFYAQTEQMREQISAEDYRRLFETIWQDRAENPGWNLQIV